jgi:hypothetical protein
MTQEILMKDHPIFNKTAIASAMARLSNAARGGHGVFINNACQSAWP